VRLAGRILLLVATLLAKLTGLDELLDAIMLPLAFIEYHREREVGKPILRSSDLVTHGSKQ
jgi:hypothetical protein